MDYHTQERTIEQQSFVLYMKYLARRLPQFITKMQQAVKRILRYRLLRLVLVVLLALFVVLVVIYPRNLFNDPLSSILKDSQGHLLGARVATDGQWRFPAPELVPEKYLKAVIAFEDKRFFYHPGVDVLAMVHSAAANFRARSIVRGGSTITMQVIRLSRKGQSRTVSEKIVETFYALSLELFKSKNDIMLLYAAHAPYGGNVVGLEAASWRWFGRDPFDLSWAEAATLAILPNAPSMISIQKNRSLFLQKRNNLLRKLAAEKVIDSLTLRLAMAEPIPSTPLALPNKAPHYLEFLRKKYGDRLFTSDIIASYQNTIAQVLQAHHERLLANQIHNLAIVVRETSTGKIWAYHGNVPSEMATKDQYNDLVQTERSSGSILKPLLYAAALQEGLIHPNSLLPDIPSYFSGFSPKNFDENYAGAVPASKALQQSLNVPFVHLLKDFTTNKFYSLLHAVGFSSFRQTAQHYGLSLILGGGEVNLWELSEVYAKMARTLLTPEEENNFPLSAGSVWLTTEVLRSLNRPETESGWSYGGSGRNMAWKTGTSFGYRDAWAVGYTPEWVIAVWVGNADGFGRPGITGISAAAPLLFDVAASLPQAQQWFQTPLNTLEKREVCHETGYGAGVNCNNRDTVIALLNSPHPVKVCPYHQLLRTNLTLTAQLPADCFPMANAVVKSWLVLPPLMEHYYVLHHPEYLPPPPIESGCYQQNNLMDFVYPPSAAIIYLPKDYSGQFNTLFFEVVHRNPQAVIYWNVDENFLGTTTGGNHRKAMPPLEIGNHFLTVTDGEGNRQQRSFRLEYK